MNIKPLSRSSFVSLVLIAVTLFSVLVVTMSIPWLTVVKIALLLVGMIILVQKPYLSLRAIIIALPFLWSLGDIPIFTFGGLSVNIPMLVGGIVFLRYGFFLMIDFGKDKIFNTLRILIIIYMLFGIPTILFSSSLINGIGIYLRVYSPLIIMVAFYKYSETKKLALANINSFCLAFFAIIASYLIGVINGDFMTTFGGLSRIRASYVPATAWGGYLSVMVGVLLIGLLFAATKKLKRYYMIEIAIVGLALYLTYNRTGWVGAFIIIIVAALFQKKEKITQFLLLVLLVGVLINFSDFTNSLLRYSNEYNEYTNLNEILSGRTTVNSVNWEYFVLEAPLINKLFGIGYYQSSLISAERYGMALIVHNDFLIVLVEQGIFSFFAYLALIGFLIFVVISDYIRSQSVFERDFIAIIIGMIAMFVITGFVGNFYGRILNAWFLFGILGIYLAYRRHFHTGVLKDSQAPIS